MQPQGSPTALDPTSLALMQKRSTLEGSFRNGVNWFYWIAGLSVINSAIYLFGGSLTFVVGLGITQFIDGFMTALGESLRSPTVPRVIGFLLDLAVAAIFVAAGYLGRKRHRWAIIAGMIFYVLDTLLVLVFADWLGAAFHALALLGLWRGLKSIGQIEELDRNQIPQAIGPSPA